jgi:N-formylglutamate deformylase
MPVTGSYTLHRGTTPLLLSMPHAGTVIPDRLAARLQPRALQCEDTDWHLERLYAFARELGVSLLVPRYSRYLIDLNRPPDDAPLYGNTNGTGLCPVRFFTGEPLYRPGHEPDRAEVEERLQQVWQPYHGALIAELARLQATHGHAVLFDAHSIRSEVPWLFPGRLPDLNLGTANGSSCAQVLRDALGEVLSAQPRYTHVTDGRFKGGYITRHYGRPDSCLHAVQLEMCQHLYMDESPPFDWDDARTVQLLPLLKAFVRTLLEFRP